MNSFKEFYEKYPNLAFVKSRIEIKEQKDMKDENLIFEDDTPPLEHGFSVVIPLYEKAYPHVFNEGTAMEVGLYAVDLCEKNEWDITPVTVNEIFRNLEISLSKEDK